MTSFTIILHIYNSPLALVVTPLAMAPYSFLVKTLSDKSESMVIKRLPGKGWIGEMVKMKFFTKNRIFQPKMEFFHFKSKFPPKIKFPT